MGIEQLYLSAVSIDRVGEQCVLMWTSRWGDTEPWRSYRLVVSDRHALLLACLPTESVYGYILAKQCDELEVAGKESIQ
jgi:hypothetical protein